MSGEAIANFVAFTGASPQEATMFLEMSGGNVQIAVELFFGGGAAGGGGAASSSSNTANNQAAELPPWFRIVWGLKRSEPVPVSWLEQPLEFSGSSVGPYAQFGLVQKKNGPCGVLAALNAVLLAQVRKHPSFSSTNQLSNADLTAAIVRVMRSTLVAAEATGNARLRIATWKDGAPSSASVTQRRQAGQHVEGIVFTDVKQEDAVEFVSQHLPHYVGPGGLLLIVYTCVRTHPGGVKAVEREIRSSGGEPPMIFGPFTLCTSELLSLMLRGSGDGNVSVRVMLCHSLF